MIVIYIIRRVSSSWNGCDGPSTSRTSTNRIFTSETQANEKCKEIQEKYGRRGPGYSVEYEVYKDYVITPSDSPTIEKDKIIGERLTVGQLIDLLSKFPRDMGVCDNGWNGITTVEKHTWQDDSNHGLPDTDYVWLI